MAKSKMFKVVMNMYTYDVLSADTGFYAFVDNSRLYYAFNELMHPDDVQMFIEHTDNPKEGGFVLRMLNVDGSIAPYYATIEPWNVCGQMQIKLIDIDGLIDAERSFNSQLAIQHKMIELYGDDVFIYYPQTNEIKVTAKFNIAPIEKIYTLEEFEALLDKHVEEEKKGDVAEFIMALRIGSRYFGICVDGDIIDEDAGTKFTLIKGAAVYQHGERFVSVGYIHKGVERTSASVRKSEVDSLTGLLSKGEITDMAIKAIDVDKKLNISLAIVDVDYFKKVNDTYGHMVGDEILREVAAIMEGEVGNSGVVGRIGGDEFIILYYDAYNMEFSRERIRSIKNTVSAKFPKNDEGKPAITLSIGCAAYPKDADNYKDLFMLADFSLYMAKKKGRNRYIIYDKEKHGTLDEISEVSKESTRINGRGDMSQGDVMCVIMEYVFGKEGYTLERLLDDYLENFEAERITVYDLEQGKVIRMVGAQVPSAEIIRETEGYIHGEFWRDRNNEDVVHDIASVEVRDKAVYKLMKKQGVFSCIHIKFQDKTGRKCVLSLEAVTKILNWNMDKMRYYKLMARLLSYYAMEE